MFVPVRASLSLSPSLPITLGDNTCRRPSLLSSHRIPTASCEKKA